MLRGITNSTAVRLTSNINITSVAATPIIAIQNQRSVNLDMRNTSIVVGGSVITSTGVTNSSFAFSRIENSRIRSFLTSDAQASYGIDNTVSSAGVRVINSTVSGDTRPIRANFGSGSNESYVSFSTLGGNGETSGSPVCRFNVDENNVALTSNCREP